MFGMRLHLNLWVSYFARDVVNLFSGNSFAKLDLVHFCEKGLVSFNRFKDHSWFWYTEAAFGFMGLALGEGC
jgi:hypothetical protein